VFFDPNNAPINMNLLWEYINQYKNCLSFYIEIRLDGIGETTNIETEVINSYSLSVDKPYNTEFLFKTGDFFLFVLLVILLICKPFFRVWKIICEQATVHKFWKKKSAIKIYANHHYDFCLTD
jgi:hypothetical protein